MPFINRENGTDAESNFEVRKLVTALRLNGELSESGDWSPHSKKAPIQKSVQK